MKPLPPTTTLAIDDKTTFEISKMSPEIQQLVEFYDDWRQQEQDRISDLNMVRAALRDLQQQLTARVQEELAQAAAEQQEAPSVEDVAVKPSRPRGRR
jgi:siroheme synthase (precorrin-2 oxidase/ferrochelatase)